jgi:hypothetical protein
LHSIKSDRQKEQSAGETNRNLEGAQVRARRPKIKFHDMHSAFFDKCVNRAPALVTYRRPADRSEHIAVI